MPKKAWGKATEQEAEAMQARQAQAHVRRLNRRIEDAEEGRYRDFLKLCRQDIAAGM